MIELLPSEVEQRLLAEGRQGENAVVIAHLPLVAGLARHFASARCDEEELRAVGALALTQAVRRFDRRHQARFSSYARVAVQRAMLRHLAANEHAVFHIPERVWEDIRAARRKRHPDEEDRWLIALGRDAVSLNTRLADGHGELGDMLPAEDPDDAMGSADVTEAELWFLFRFRGLSHLERTVVACRTGLFQHPMTFAKIAAEVGYSERHVRRIYHRTIRRLLGRW